MPYQQTQEGDSRDSKGGTQNGGGASAALHFQAPGRVLVPLRRGPPQAGDSEDPQPSPLALADSPRPWAVARSRRSSGNIVQMTGCQRQECRRPGSASPWDPPAAANHPHSCAGRGPVANRSGSFPWGAFPMPQRPPARRAENCHARGTGRQQPSPRQWGRECQHRVMPTSGLPADPTGASMCPSPPPNTKCHRAEAPGGFGGARCPHPPQLQPCTADSGGLVNRAPSRCASGAAGGGGGASSRGWARRRQLQM